MPRFLRQFGLRSLLLFCTLAAGCFGLWRWHMTWIHQQHEIAAQLAESGGTIRWSTWGPGWIHNVFGSFYFSEITVVDFHRRRITDSQMQLVGQIPSLEELYVPGTRISDQGMEVLEDLPRIRKLSVWRTKLTNKSLEHIGKLQNLEVLDIQRTRMNEEGLVHLRDHPRLRILRHNQTMGNVGIDHLASIPNLFLEQLVAEKLDFSGLKHLRDRIRVKRLTLLRPNYEEWAALLTGHPTIEDLSVIDAPMTDKEFRDLTEADKLAALYLSSVPIGDGAIGGLPYLANLRRLQLQNTHVTSTRLMITFGVYPKQVLVKPDLIRLSGMPKGQVVEWYGTDASSDIEALKYVRNVKWLTIEQDARDIQTIDFSWLSRLSKLETLRINNVGPSELLSQVAMLKELNQLDLYKADKLDVENLRRVTQLPKLVTLSLRSCEVDDQHMEVIGQMKQLEALNLASSVFTDVGVEHIAGLDNLVVLHINNCRNITDEALRSIAKLPSLQYLSLQDTNITDEGLKYLHAMPRLINLLLIGTKRTQQGIQLLRDSLPMRGGHIY